MTICFFLSINVIIICFLLQNFKKKKQCYYIHASELAFLIDSSIISFNQHHITKKNSFTVTPRFQNISLIVRPLQNSFDLSTIFESFHDKVAFGPIFSRYQVPYKTSLVYAFVHSARQSCLYVCVDRFHWFITVHLIP